MGRARLHLPFSTTYHRKPLPQPVDRRLQCSTRTREMSRKIYRSTLPKPLSCEWWEKLPQRSSRWSFSHHQPAQALHDSASSTKGSQRERFVCDLREHTHSVTHPHFAHFDFTIWYQSSCSNVYCTGCSQTHALPLCMYPPMAIHIPTDSPRGYHWGRDCNGAQPLPQACCELFDLVETNWWQSDHTPDKRNETAKKHRAH